MLYSSLVKTFFRMLYGEPPDLSADGDGRGLVLVADGCGGHDLGGTCLRYVMGALDAPYVVQVVPWGHGFGRWHADLTDAVNRDARAREMADAVIAFRTRRPRAPVFLVGKSAGTGLVVKALEHLPDDAVKAAVLLAPALSPTYDLTRALCAVRREMVVFWSPLDIIVLGLGTRIFGTIDRIKSVSAGMVGFRPPEPRDDEQWAQYRKLRQVRWHPGMAPTGYLGGHVGPDSPAFLRKYVVPLLRVADDEGEELRPVSRPQRTAPIT
jgi:pimeloyl-ACP methyl ester carboxylesterase